MTHAEALIEFEPLTLAEAQAIYSNLVEYKTYSRMSHPYYGATRDGCIVTWLASDALGGFHFCSLHSWDPTTNDWEWYGESVQELYDTR